MRKYLFYQFLGEKIKKKREEKGITILELSKKSDVRKDYLQKIENGQARKLSIIKLCKIANALSTSPQVLVEGWKANQHQKDHRQNSNS